MQTTESLKRQSSQNISKAPSPAVSDGMETRPHCAYNQTRECFLGLEIQVADRADSAVAEKLRSLSLKSGEGLWIVPYRAIVFSGPKTPLDLIFLDQQGCVIETVESFPSFRVSPSSPTPASVLVLPAHSIYSSQTQIGDQLLICVAEEMGVRLESLQARGTRASVTVQSAVLLREEPLWSGGPGMVEFETPASALRSSKEQLHLMSLVKPEFEEAATPRNWLQRWWSPDPRSAPRENGGGLAAYYWNGAAPEAHGIRDISSSGLYLITEERWYPGTLVLMTLQRTDVGEQAAERSIAVLSRAVRWGQDGVGLQFVLADSKEKRKGYNPVMESADRRDLEKFLQQLRAGKELKEVR